MTYRCGIVRDVVRWGIENNRQPISLDDLRLPINHQSELS